MIISTSLVVLYVIGTSPTLAYCTFKATKWTVTLVYKGTKHTIKRITSSEVQSY